MQTRCIWRQALSVAKDESHLVANNAVCVSGLRFLRERHGIW
jgi:hypothetical protein